MSVEYNLADNQQKSSSVATVTSDSGDLGLSPTGFRYTTYIESIPYVRVLTYRDVYLGLQLFGAYAS